MRKLTRASSKCLSERKKWSKARKNARADRDREGNAEEKGRGRKKKGETEVVALVLQDSSRRKSTISFAVSDHFLGGKKAVRDRPPAIQMCLRYLRLYRS